MTISVEHLSFDFRLAKDITHNSYFAVLISGFPVEWVYLTRSIFGMFSYPINATQITGINCSRTE
jgi:hypothetical protein